VTVVASGMEFLEEIEERILCGDGAIGTLLLADGIPRERCFEELCISEPERIERIHEQYIRAGARVIETNTFGANAVRLERFGLEGRVAEINRAAVQLARKAARGRNIYVAGSVGPLGLKAEEATARGIDRAQCFREQINALLEAGVEIIFFETFMDFAEMEIAFRAKKELSDIPEICSFSCAPEAQLACGIPLADAFGKLRELGAKMVGVNCLNDPKETLQLLRRLPAQQCVAAYPTAGQPEYREGVYVYPIAPAAFAEAARGMAAAGARLIGGCCGTTPNHIAAMAAEIADL
jgi:methionine synthase / methylenetetrahydrofolate reductase(NADPH)